MGIWFTTGENSEPPREFVKTVKCTVLFGQTMAKYNNSKLNQTLNKKRETSIITTQLAQYSSILPAAIPIYPILQRFPIPVSLRKYLRYVIHIHFATRYYDSLQQFITRPHSFHRCSKLSNQKNMNACEKKKNKRDAHTFLAQKS